MKTSLPEFFKRKCLVPPIGELSTTSAAQLPCGLAAADCKVVRFTNVACAAAGHSNTLVKPEFSLLALTERLRVARFAALLQCDAAHPSVQLEQVPLRALDFRQACTLHMPAELVPSSFEMVGHIAHFNLRPEQLPHRFFIGETLLRTQPNIRTVVNKTESLSSEFRECRFELLAGDADYAAVVVEEGLRLAVDFEKVYWNSRLSNERKNITAAVPANATVFDVMAGVGGFAVSLAKKKNCTVFANDLNGAAAQLIAKNAKLNRVADKVHAFNMDGGEFVRRAPTLAGARPAPLYFIMNLPCLALEFLENFAGQSHFVVFAYCFAHPARYEAEIAARLEAFPFLARCSRSVRIVRDVAPSKRMYCVCLRAE